MSTHGVIGFGTGPDVWLGRYHHFDSYPQGLGKALWDAIHGHFAGDVEAAKEVLFWRHKAGWSTIVTTSADGESLTCCDFSRAPGWHHPHDGITPMCYCHGERAEGPELYTSASEPPGWGCWAYIFEEGGSRMWVLFAADPRAGWREVAEVNLDGPEPDWRALGRAAYNG